MFAKVEPNLPMLVVFVLLSEDYGWRKPRAAEYLAAASALDTETQGCLFIDDLRRNVTDAESTGMLGNQYRPGLEPHITNVLMTTKTEGES